ncbi:hypothetical protein J6590_042698 [Homalodisca vitripennis]|nr:hypothetical protein J6590_042698 [Homalodisca vitripennis]
MFLYIIGDFRVTKKKTNCHRVCLVDNKSVSSISGRSRVFPSQPFTALSQSRRPFKRKCSFGLKKPCCPVSARHVQQLLDSPSRQCAGAHCLPLQLSTGQDGGSGASPSSKQPRRLYGRRFDIRAIQNAVTDELKGILKEEFKKCFQQWKNRFLRCIYA